MPALIAPILVLFGFARDVVDLFKQPKYRSLIIWVLFTLVIGTVFYHNVEGWSWLDSLYFSVVTLATVGYGDLAPATEYGRAFTIVYIMLGLGLLTSFAAMLAQERRQRYSDRSEGDSSIA